MIMFWLPFTEPSTLLCLLFLSLHFITGLFDLFKQTTNIYSKQFLPLFDCEVFTCLFNLEIRCARFPKVNCPLLGLSSSINSWRELRQPVNHPLFDRWFQSTFYAYQVDIIKRSSLNGFFLLVLVLRI